ncbi:MAG TPA: CGNR zinc finger domain-containing protein [Actinomycetota bacterium]|nr:CGNR zinc finger domain-containing protein [Actinomycetota bacterium]
MIDIREHLNAAPSAPGDLEILQRFLNLHEHAPDGRTLDPPLEMIRTFLVERRLLTREQRFTEADRETYLELRRALRALIGVRDGESLAEADAAVIDRLGQEAGLHPHFRAERRPTLEPRGRGVAAAFGRVVAIAFVGSFDGSLAHMKLCASEDCRAAFYDRSKNRSGRWCSMETCGNRAKVRAWRERQRTTP